MENSSKKNETINQITSSLDLLTRAVAVGTVALIFIGYGSLHFYYVLFGIDIYRYLETGEVLLSFVGSYFETFLMILTYGGLLLIPNLIARLFKKKQVIEVGSEVGPEKVNLKIASKKELILVSIGCVLLYISLIWFLLNDYANFDDHKPYFPFLVIVIFPMSCVTILLVIISENRGKTDSILTILFFFFCLFYFGLVTYKEAKGVIEHEEGKIVELFFQNRPSLKSDTSIVFVGATKKYYFFKYLERSEVIIVPASEVVSEKRYLNDKRNEKSPLDQNKLDLKQDSLKN